MNTDCTDRFMSVTALPGPAVKKKKLKEKKLNFPEIRNNKKLIRNKQK